MRKPEQDPVVVVGRSCRLPGASSIDALWDNLVAGRSSVTQVPDDRWSKLKHGHPRPKEPGKAYTWAAGVLDDIWSFDPGVFGISPREAEQMDPQQRLLLELTWEAIEDAGLRRSDLAGRDVGVFVGASSPEYTVIRNTDIAGGDAYTATGGAVSIISNRISHAFDFQGPSFTVDTACSSSLVALHQAMEALRGGRIDTAIVGGINLLMSPFGFVIFSQASMLSPTGLCQTFDARANGYVRAEGAVVLVLQTEERARQDGTRAYTRIAASGVNSDGRTNGIALPSRFSQAKLLRQVYSEAGIEPDRMAFVEAHGTGTRVGDPIEAFTIGEVLGKGRSEPLLIGSIKSNIGHLEPASGLAGMLKAMLALEHDLLPPSINYSEPNPDIPFDELNLRVCAEATPLPRGDGPRFAGVNSFGFGGTNSHAVICDPPARPTTRKKRGAAGPERFALAGASRDAVRALARTHAAGLGTLSSEGLREVASATAHRRDMLTERLVVEWGSPRDLARKLERIADKDEEVAGASWGSVVEADAPVAFVFSGNGGQWPGMGRGAYATNRAFREGFDEVDALFDGQFGWSVTEALFANDLDQRLQFTHVAQPLIFAIQIATARALAAEGLVPSFVLGHSVGEIAAAVVSGGLTLKDGVRVIHARSAHQELARDTGRMAVVVGSLDQVADLIDEEAGVEIAAFNSPRTFTVAGPTEAIKALGARARKRRMVFRQLDLDYPFHCGLIDCVREPLLKDLAGLKAAVPHTAFISTVTGGPIEGRDLDAGYWWRNVREPVRFSGALDRAAQEGARVFVEIGPRSVLLSNISETIEGLSLPFAALGVLEKREEETRDPIGPAAVNAFVKGAAIDLERLLGPVPADPIRLPTYPWQRKEYRVGRTPEAVGFTLDTRWHRLIGNRNTADGVEWTGQLDTTAIPELADHKVGGQAILPAAAFIEIALSVARDWFETENAALLDLEISLPLQLEHDRAKEVRARLSPNTNTVEIMSRARLSRSGWTVHATAKITAGAEEPIAVAPPSGDGEAFDVAAVYAVAERVGLHYGPSFRLLRSVRKAGERGLLVALEPSAPHGDYRLDPARLDACFHGLFALFSGLGAGRRGTAYLPVRFGHTRLTKPGAAPASALIEVRKSGERSILSDFTLFDAAGEPIARLDDVRFQAARLQRAATLDERALVLNERPADGRTLGEVGSGTNAEAVLASVGALGVPTGAEALETEEQLLLEGWATSASAEAAARLFPGGSVSQAEVAALPEERAAWLANILHSLELSGLAAASDEGWTLTDPGSIPPAALILRTLAAEAPARSTEIVLAAAVTAGLRADGALAAESAPIVASGTVDGFELGGAAVRGASELAFRILEAAGLTAMGGRAATVLQVGYGPLSHALSDLARTGQLRLTVIERDGRRLERGKLSLGTVPGVAFAESVEALDGTIFDVAVAAERLHRLGSEARLTELRGALAPGGILVAVEPMPSHFRDVALGLAPGWFEAGASVGFPVGPIQSDEGWVKLLEGCGFASVSATPVSTGAEAALLVVAEPGTGIAAPVALERTIRIHAAAGAGELASSLDALLAMDGHQVAVETGGPALDLGRDAPDTVVFVADASRTSGDAAIVREIGLSLQGIAAEYGAREKTELWVVALSASGRHPQADPVTAAILGFARTLANETPKLVVRRVAVAVGVAGEAVAATMRALMASEQAETDFAIDAEGCRVLRVETLDGRDAGAPAPAAQLEKGQVGGLSGLEWIGVGHVPPGPHEVEIAVEASGLNFRDVMWAMSLLPDDILEDGFAGPTLGLECAGTVRSVGAGVTRLKAGDRVLAFAPSAFKTVVNVPENVVTHIPAGVTTEAAATIPVAFLTAYYGLVTLAGIRPGDWVLIHGAAGGVGLAAVQIAQHKGANVIATAGSREKRELLSALGVEHVLNSRSTAFADDLRSINRDGVDVVLNSLAGEAMERGLSTLKPFGRFIELGKRDYVANTRIGLRPFRRNLSYFGVDVDQLLSDRDRASEIFAEVIGLFAEGVYKALPYRVFPAGETVDAFRLMQQSGHVGKIVVRPPTAIPPLRSEAEFPFAQDRTHLLTGGFGGFGIETARWLADRGVRHLVMTGRSGAASEEAQALVAELAARGVAVKAVACDVSDERALTKLLKEVRAEMPPLAGILHAAMVLEDSLLANLTAEQFGAVLAPKVTGAALLDTLTREDTLDYFVLFSSITTFVGNPGQAAYVAANAYLEGLARQRRETGLPALALAWGAISDVGVLARQKGLAEALAKRVGVKAMPAREALDLMVQALSRDPEKVGNAVIAIGSLDWSAARRLPALSSPTFAALVREGGAIETSERQSIDLRALVASGEPEGVRKQVIGVIVEEIATVLRVPKQDVALGKRLAEVGLDSLMAIELATALQERFELGSPPTGSVGALTVPGLAEHIIQAVQTGAPDDESRVTQALHERHGGEDVDLGAATEVMKAVQEKAATSTRGVLQ